MSNLICLKIFKIRKKDRSLSGELWKLLFAYVKLFRFWEQTMISPGESPDNLARVLFLILIINEDPKQKWSKWKLRCAPDPSRARQSCVWDRAKIRLKNIKHGWSQNVLGDHLFVVGNVCFIVLLVKKKKKE